MTVGARVCRAPAYAPAAAYNVAASLGLITAPFGRQETGWAVYGPLARRSVKSRCAPESEEFARRLAVWQGRSGLSPTGALDGPTLLVLKTEWQARRPFFVARQKGAPCPEGAQPAALAPLDPDETLGGKPVMLRADALFALRRLRAAAKRDVGPEEGSLLVFSGYRSPEADAARCARDGNCLGVTRAACSAHRTGLAVDLDVGAAEGFSPDSSADANRLFQSRGRAYRWLLARAGAYGFVNYPFEPWHWEWTPLKSGVYRSGGQLPP